MTKKHKSFPKIGQFRQVIREVQTTFTYKGKDESGNPIYDNNCELPTINFKGTVKLHGTNAAVCWGKDGIYYQSRNRVLTPEDDNAGFAKFAHSRTQYFRSFINYLILMNEIDIKKNVISIFGEWAGTGIQRGVGIAEVNRGFYIFGAKVTNNETEEVTWLDSGKMQAMDFGIFNIEDFETYSIDIDFNNPELSTEKLIEITNKVEEECPVAKMFEVEKGTGEGVVWKANVNGRQLIFKVKGEKHSVSKVKKLASVDVEKVKSVNSFIEYSFTQNRFDQAIKEVFNDDPVDIKKLGDVIRWVNRDINSEESDTLEANGLTNKDIAGKLAKAVKDKFFKIL